MADKTYLDKVYAYRDEQKNGLLRTFFFAVAWLFALLFALAAQPADGDLHQYKHDDHFKYESSLASFAIVQAVGFGLDLVLHVLKKCFGNNICNDKVNVGKLNDVLRELAILVTACAGLVGFTYGMVAQGNRHSFTQEQPQQLRHAIATYSYLATAVLGMARLRNIDIDGKDQVFKVLDRDDIEKSSVGAKYNKVPTQPTAHNFY